MMRAILIEDKNCKNNIIELFMCTRYCATQLSKIIDLNKLKMF